MKILFVIDSLGPGGKERRMTELLKALKPDLTFDFELVIMSNEIHYKDILNLGIKIHPVIRKSRKDLLVFRSLYRICKNYKPDIVHCWESMTAIYCAPVCKVLNIRVVNGMVIDTPVKRNIRNKNWLRARLTFPFSSVVVGNSQAGLDAYNAPKNRSICIYNGINMSRFSALRDSAVVLNEIIGQVDDDVFIAGMVAAFDERKDYFSLIESAIPLCRKHHKLRYVLVGEGIYFENIRRMIPRDLSDRIILTGKRSDVESVIAIFSIGLLMTNTMNHGEGISNSIIEYMAMAKPVIATRGGGTVEAVEDGETGFLVTPSDPCEIADKIEILMGDAILCKRMGLAGLKRIKEKFSINNMVRQYTDLYLRMGLKGIHINKGLISGD